MFTLLINRIAVFTQACFPGIFTGGTSDLYKPPLYRSTPVFRVGIVGCLRAYLILYCNNFRVHQIRCYHPGRYYEFIVPTSLQ